MTSLLTGALVGSQTPRISSWPGYISSAGQDAIDLAESAGLYLDPWQQLVLRHSLGERRGGKWTSFEVGLVVPRQNGKGAVLEARELYGLFLGAEKLIVHTSHLFSTSLEAFRRIRMLIEATPDLKRQVKLGNRGEVGRTTTGQEVIELTNGNRLRFMARSKGSGRGLSGDLVILDEAYSLDDAVIEALLPTMLARPNPQLWYTSSPVLDSETGFPLTAMRKRGIVGDDGLAYFEWSVDAHADMDDRANWAMANPGLGYRVTEEILTRARSSMTDAGFAREILCIWPPEGDAQWQVITKAQWESAVATEQVTHDPVVLALESSPDRLWSSLAVAGGRPDGDVGAAVIEHAAGLDWTVARVVAEVARQRPCRLVVNAGGAAASVIPDIVTALAEAKARAEAVRDFDLASAFDVELVSPTTPQRAAAYGMVHDALTRPEHAEPWRLWCRDHEALTAAVAAARPHSVGAEGTTWEWTVTDASPLKAVTHAVWGFNTREVVPDIDIAALVAWR